MPGVHHDRAVGFGVIAILPEVAAPAWRHHHQHGCVGEPLLAGDEGEGVGARLRGRERLQWSKRMRDRVIVVEARRQAVDALHQHVGLDRVQAAPGRTGLLQRRRAFGDFAHLLGAEGALQQA